MIDSKDRQKAQPVAMINEAMALQFFPNQDPIGQQVQLDVVDDLPRQIIGVVGNVRQDRYQTRPQPQVYVPRTQLPSFMDMTMSFEILVPSFIVRTAGDPGAMCLRCARLCMMFRRLCRYRASHGGENMLPVSFKTYNSMRHC